VFRRNVLTFDSARRGADAAGTSFFAQLNQAFEGGSVTLAGWWLCLSGRRKCDIRCRSNHSRGGRRHNARFDL
jgi:hypothetical protein